MIVLDSQRENSNSPTVFLALMGTVTLSCLTGSIRVHRLCAKLDEHPADLIVELEKLRALPDDKRLEQRFVVEKAWSTLRRTLANKIDTGLRSHLIWLSRLLAVVEIVERLVPDELWEMFQRV
ncbi:hypothetical protein, partial [Streptomyces sioyaensis]|uniref:hypothetical protein n=1 Tax=Streptomyces sioyaensis TaxID=67364 RepID=UPI0036E366B4